MSVSNAKSLLHVALGLVLILSSPSASAFTTEPLPSAPSGTVGVGKTREAVSPLTRASFEAVKRQVGQRLRGEEGWHLSSAGRAGVELTPRDYRRALVALDDAQVLSEAAWIAKMRGVWARCAKTDACTAPILKNGALVKTVTYVRASAIPNATSRPVTHAQLADLLEHEVAHVLLIHAGFQGNQDAFITDRWTLGSPDSALASHKACNEGLC